MHGNPRLCLSLCRTPTDDLDDQIEAASQAGFTCVELRALALDAFLGPRPLLWLDMLLKQHKVHSLVLNGLTLPLPGYGEYSAYSQAYFLELCTHLDALGGGTIVLQPAEFAREGRGRSAENVRALRTYADLAAPFDVTLAFEFSANSTVSDWEAAQHIVDRAARSNLRLSISTHEWYKSKAEPGDLDTLKPGQLALVHLDSPLPSPSAAATAPEPSPQKEEAARTLALCRQLEAAGFRGPYCIPLDAQPWARIERARAVRQAALDLLKALDVKD